MTINRPSSRATSLATPVDVHTSREGGGGGDALDFLFFPTRTSQEGTKEYSQRSQNIPSIPSLSFVYRRVANQLRRR